MDESLRGLLNLVFTLLYLAIFARVIVSWIAPSAGGTNPIVNFIYQITEPILGPLRKIIPRVGMFDFTPMIVLIVIALIQTALNAG